MASEPRPAALWLLQASARKAASTGPGGAQAWKGAAASWAEGVAVHAIRKAQLADGGLPTVIRPPLPRHAPSHQAPPGPQASMCTPSIA